MLKIFTLKHPLEDIPRLTGRKRIRSNSRINENNSSSSSLNLWAREARSGSRARRLILREMRGLWNRDALQMPATRSDRSEANRWSDGIYPLRFNNRVPSPSRKEEREIFVVVELWMEHDCFLRWIYCGARVDEIVWLAIFWLNS